MTKRVLLVDDDREVREALGQTLELADLEPILAGSYVAAKDHIAPGFDGVIVQTFSQGFWVKGYQIASTRPLSSRKRSKVRPLEPPGANSSSAEMLM